MFILDKIKTIKNNSIELLSPTSFDPKKETLLFIGVVHGDETEGLYLFKKIQKYLQGKKTERKKNILFISCLNPDGMALNSRANANGVDLNRNLPTQNWKPAQKGEATYTTFFGGNSPGSELETQFLVRIIEKYTPGLIVTFHSPLHCVNYDGSARDIAKKICDLNGYRLAENIGYGTPGSLGTWAGVERKIPIITYEFPKTESIAKLEALWKDNKCGIKWLLKL